MRFLSDQAGKVLPELLMLTACKAKQHAAAALPALTMPASCESSMLGTWPPPGHSLVGALPNDVSHGKQFLLAAAGSTVMA